jgi:hypothetical protein
MIEMKIHVIENNTDYLVMGPSMSACDLDGVLTYLKIQKVPWHIMKQVRVTLPRRKELTICKLSEQDMWVILYPPD